MTKEDARSENLKIPVMFGDGRHRYINYQQIKDIHSPALTVTEILSTRADLMSTIESRRQTGVSIDQVKIDQTFQMFDQLAIESAEAIAKFGGRRWEQKPDLPELDDAKLATIFHHSIATGFGDEYPAIIKILKTSYEYLQNSQDDRAISMKENIDKIERIYGDAKKRTDPVVHVYPKVNDPTGYHREITFFNYENNLGFFSLWEASDLNQRSYRYYFMYEKNDLLTKPWEQFTAKYFPGLENIARPVSSKLLKKWRRGEIDYFSDLEVEEYRDQVNHRWYQRRERNGGQRMIVTVYYELPDDNQTNIEMHDDLIPLVPPELLSNPGLILY